MMDYDDASRELSDAQEWLDLIAQAEKKLDPWQSACDNIDRLYADLSRLRRNDGDREFQLFWSNIQVIGPSIYARPPVPVVTPKFKDRRPLYRTASELLERACNVSFDIADIDQHMLAMRDDLSVVGRATAWVRYESDDDGERVCYEHVDRKDFLHDPARKWCDVDWVARRAWMTRDEMKERFKEAAEYVSYSGEQGDEVRECCGVWELWCKSKNKVVWVTEGCPTVLDEDEPHIKLANFFPCPRPAYATIQRRSLIPVPDIMFYQGQLDEINLLTSRIHALSEAIKVRGFYAGGGDIGDAIERAIRLTDDTQILVPVPSMAALMQGGGDPIVWLPIQMVAETIRGLIELRRQVIDDVYQIIGLSDIMRGMTDSSETLGAQRLKQQNGSYRVRDKQNELVRVARDLVRLGAEIMAEEFDRDTLIDMAQLDIPTEAEIKSQLADLRKQGEAEMRGMLEQAEQAAQQPGPDGQPPNPEQIKQQFMQQQQAVTQKYAAQAEELSQTVTIDAVMKFLSDEKLRPFVLDIETDSTVYPDEAAEKASRAEFMQAFAGTMQALMPMMSMGPEAISVAGGVFKFALAPYRVGRELEGLIDDFVDQGPAMAERMQKAQGGGESDEMAQAALQMAQAEVKKAEAATMKVQVDGQKAQMDMQLRAQEAQAKQQADQQRFALEVQQTKGAIEETQARIEKVFAEIQLAEQRIGLEAHRERREDAKAVADITMRRQDQAMSAQDRDRAAAESDRNFAAGRQDVAMTQQKDKTDG